jgi:hypothetical protein
MEHKSRRETLRTIGAAALAGGVATAAASSSPDAHLLRLGAEFDRLYAAWLPIHAEVERLDKEFEKEWAKKGLSIDENLEPARYMQCRIAAWRQLQNEIGVDAALSGEDAACKLLDAVTKKIRGTPATTIVGLAVKARALRFDTHLSTQCDLQEKDQDWPERVMSQFIAEIERLAAADLPRA